MLKRPPAGLMMVCIGGTIGKSKRFQTKKLKKIGNRQWVKALPREVQRNGLRKLLMIHSAVTLDDLKVPPGNRLEKLYGDRESISGLFPVEKW